MLTITPCRLGDERAGGADLNGWNRSRLGTATLREGIWPVGDVDAVPFFISKLTGRAPMDQLLQLGEIALVFVGFVAIFIAVTRDANGMSLIELLYVKTIVVESVVSAFIALVPVSCALLGLTGPKLWHVSSGLGLALLVGGGSVLAPGSLAALRATPSSLDRLFIAIGWILAATGTAAMVLNAGGWLWGPSLGPHFLSVVLFLAIGALAFLVIVFRRLQSATP